MVKLKLKNMMEHRPGKCVDNNMAGKCMAFGYDYLYHELFLCVCVLV